MTSVEVRPEEHARQLRALAMHNGGSTLGQIAEELGITAEQAHEDILGAIAAALDTSLVTFAARSAAPAPAVEAASVPATAEGDQFRTFTDAPVGIIGEPSSDRRLLVNGIELAFRQCPVALTWCEKSAGGHDNADTVGVIESMSRRDNQVVISGYLLNTPEADKAAEQFGHGVSSPSLDIGDADWHYADDAHEKIENEQLIPYLESGRKMFKAYTKGEVIGVTMVSRPAFGALRISLNEAREPREAALVASAAEEFRPRVYDHRLFEDPKLAGPTPLTMDANGRIFGHLAIFGQCHRSMQSDCILVPRSPSSYAHFHTSPPVQLDNGQSVHVGRLIVGTRHADMRLRAAATFAHYSDTGNCYALVRAGEDKFGVWVSGVAAPGATAEMVEQGITAPLSGDWRNIEGRGLDLIAVLSVNNPGFAVQGTDDSEGRPLALVACLGPDPRLAAQPTRDDFRRWIQDAVVETLAIVEPPRSPAEMAKAVNDGIILMPAAADAPTDLVTPVAEATYSDEKSPTDQIADLLAQAGA